MVRNLPVNAGDAIDMSSIPASGRSADAGNGNLLQYPFLENSSDRGAWWATVQGATKSHTQLSTRKVTKTIMAIVKGHVDIPLQSMNPKWLSENSYKESQKE